MLYIVPDNVYLERYCAEKPSDTQEVESQEARSSGVAVCQNCAEGETVAIEADNDENCKICVSSSRGDHSR